MLKEASIVLCCKETACYECLQQNFVKSKACPLCRQSENTFIDKMIVPNLQLRMAIQWVNRQIMSRGKMEEITVEVDVDNDE
jgi:23S rRNA A1618 N6-methylase RlmF